MASNRKFVVVCSPDRTFSAALRIVLEGHEVVGIPALEDLEGQPDALVYRVDGALPIEGLAEVAQRVPTVVLGDEEHLMISVDANCRGFLLKNNPLDQIAEAVLTVLEGRAVIQPDLLGTVLKNLVVRRRDARRHLDELTDRETEVFWLAAKGLRKEEIGQTLFISPDTARTHLQRIYRKLGFHSQSELIVLATNFDTRRENP